jgi:glucose/arabinose dehydrogenase
MRRLALSILLCGLLLAACSSSDPADTGRADPQSSAPAAAPNSPAAGTQPPTTSASPAARSFDPASVSLTLEPILTGLRSPLFVTAPPDGSGRLFVVEQGGTVRIARGGQLLPQPFLDISGQVVAGGERGLLGMAFHPRYVENGRFFVMYTARGDGDNTVAAYRVSAEPDRADPGSGRVLLAIDDFAANHNAGMLAFGPDGYLYVGTGDGGGAGDPQRTSQNRNALLGKMLRLDVDSGDPYGIPRDNPFVGQSGARPEIWATGLRNPWRYSFDRATGDLWIADVGQNQLEEINVQPAGSRGGENYGWSIMEGTRCFREGSCNRDGLTMPVYEYSRDDGCSVTGGYVYRGRSQPALAGVYLVGDYCSGRIWALYRDAAGAWQRAQLADTDFSISSFGEDADGELYLTDLRGGGVYLLRAAWR